MFRNRTTKRIAALLAAYLLLVWGAGIIAYRTGLAYAASDAGLIAPLSKPDFPEPNVPEIVTASQTRFEVNGRCGTACDTPAEKSTLRRKALRGVNGSAPAPYTNEADTPLSIAIAMTSESFDLSGGVFSNNNNGRPIGLGSIPGFVLAGIPAGGGGFGGFGPPVNPNGGNPSISPPANGPGGSGPGNGGPGGSGAPTDTVTPPVIIIPPGGGTGSGPDVLETPIPGAIYLFGSAIAGLAFAGRITKR